MLSKEDGRYRDAIDELHTQLGDGEAFDAARAWAIAECRKAEKYSWSHNNQFEKGWNVASRAARRLADHLESDGWFGAQRIIQAEKQIGMKLSFDSGKRRKRRSSARVENERHRTLETAFPQLLRALSKQPIPRRQKDRLIDGFDVPGRGVVVRFSYGPLLWADTIKQRNKLPSKSTALAVGLTHGFRTINEWPIEAEPFGPFSTGPKPCYAAAVEFANAVFNKATSEDAVRQFLHRHKWSLHYCGFGD